MPTWTDNLSKASDQFIVLPPVRSIRQRVIFYLFGVVKFLMCRKIKEAGMEKTLKEILKVLKSIDDRLRKIERSMKRLDREENGEEEIGWS